MEQENGTTEQGQRTDEPTKTGVGRPKGTEVYTKAIMKSMALEAIKKNRLFLVEDVFAYVPFNRTSFYIKKVHEDKEIKEQIENNKIITRAGIRKKWYDNFNPTTQIALYRLICTQEEREALAFQKHEVTGANNEPLIPKIDDIDLSALTDEERLIFLKIARKNAVGK